LSKAILDGSDCLAADFTEANLTRASFKKAEIEEAIFTGALLSRAIWSDYKRCRVRSIGSCL